MKAAALKNYRIRMLRVLDHIDLHLDDDLDLDQLSGVAAFSRFHFHRQFMATFELSVHRYVQLARLKRASQQLTSNGAERVTDIAMEAGYDAPDAFARAFRQRFEQSPSSFRSAPDWGPWLAALGPLDSARTKLMQTTYTYDDVIIRQVLPTPVAIMEHRGDRTTVGETAKRFHAWRKANGVSPKTSSSFTVFRSEREPLVSGDYAMDICVETDQPIAADDRQVKPGMIPGGRCAVLRVDGTSNNHQAAGLFLYRDWLPASGEEARDFPLYCQRRLIFSPDSEGHEVFAELFLPIK
jgi:AraC family transcriptional regulator